MKPLEKSLLAYVKTHLRSLPQDYAWRFKHHRIAIVLGGTISGMSWSDRARSLKRLAARRWRTSTKADRLKIADIAVREWGGVKRNLTTTIQRYVDAIAAERLPGPGCKGIASWSKVAAFSNPARFAVFDARVAFSLNALQALADQAECWWFPRLPSRNGLLKSLWPALESMAVGQGWLTIEAGDVYGKYLELLKATAAKARCDIDDVEMVLFARAEALAAEFSASGLVSLALLRGLASRSLVATSLSRHG